MDALINERIFAKLVLFRRYRGYLYRLPRPRSPWHHSSGQGAFRGSLSARIASVESGNCLRLDGSPDWPDDFPVGFRLVGEDGECRVSGWNKSDSLLQFEDNLPSGLRVGDAIELLSGEEAPVLGQRLILARAGLSPKEISATMRLATTRCTNALLEGKGTEPVLFVTKGFPNLLEIGDQRRTGLFDLVPKKRPVLHGPVVEVNERLDRNGEVLQAPDFPLWKQKPVSC